MSTTEHDRWADYAGAYVLGAVAESECGAFEAHLEQCARCRAEVAELQPVSSALACAVPPMTAPPELRDRLMVTVRAEAELLRAAGAAADRPPSVLRQWLRWRPLTAALASGAMAAAVAIGFLVAGGGSPPQVEVHAHFVMPRQSGAHIVRRSHNELVVSDFPPSPAQHVYQVWTVARAGGKPHPTKKLFIVGQDGSAEVALPSLHGVSQVMVTVEQPSGSATGVPSGAPVLRATLI